MCEWNGSTYEICEQNKRGINPGIRQEVLSEIQPYLVGTLVHFIIYCLTLALIVSIFSI